MTREALEKILMTQMQDLYPHKKYPKEILALYDEQRAEIKKLKEKIEELLRRKDVIDRAYRGYATPEEEAVKRAAELGLP